MILLTQLKKKAKELLAKPTNAEREAYLILEKNKFKFEKQKIFGFFILDIYIPNRLLIVEIDGGYHKDRVLHDANRDKFCRELGLKVLRIRNEKVKTIKSKILRFRKINNYKNKTTLIFKKAAYIKKEQERKYKLKNG